MCSLFGVIDYNNVLTGKQKEKYIHTLSVECEERGTDAMGFAYVKPDGSLKIYKRPLPAHKMRLRLYRDNPKVVMGHTRLTTQGSEKYNCNNHPFYSKKLGFALAHNGIIVNDKLLREAFELPKTKIKTDSYIAVQLIENSGRLDFESIGDMVFCVYGMFSFTILTKENELYIVKGDSPIAVADAGGFYMYASTKAILLRTFSKLKIKKPRFSEYSGQYILKIKDGYETETKPLITYPGYNLKYSNIVC
ncbi:MAG: glucosamine--fructose-6-phosphate aminotransferase [Clostridiales bacterium]|nr:glucosamine--fructose-6-phosphate aminotransferase [Clostridiales bacterium]